MKIFITTLGCKVNTYESDAIKEEFKKMGDLIVGEDDQFDVAIINTCTVTNQASSKSRKIIRKMIKQNPNAIIAVMGCYSQTYTDEVKKIEGVDIILGNIDKSEIVSLIHNKKDKNEMLVKVGDILRHHEFEDLNPANFTHTRAFLKIEDGCNNFCTYCIIPYSRGPVRSKKADKVIEDIKNICNNGYKEVVLTGIHTGRYNDEGVTLTDLIKRILNETSLKRIRISSIEPNEITEELIHMMKDSERIANHLHVPLQAGSDHVLKLMNRRYTKQDYIDKINFIKSVVPDISITTDIIVGFPEETDQDFNETLELSKQLEFAKIHVFPFSLREGTKACLLKEINDTLKDQRVHKLLELDKYLEQKFMLKNINEIAEIILEDTENNYIMGHTSNYLPIYIPVGKGKKGEMVQVRITNYADQKLFGRRVDY